HHRLPQPDPGGPGPDVSWSSPQLAEFLAALSTAPDEATALSRAVESAAEALEAERADMVEGGGVPASTGFAAGHVPTRELVDAISHRAEQIDVAGIGRCRIL